MNHRRLVDLSCRLRCNRIAASQLCATARRPAVDSISRISYEGEGGEEEGAGWVGGLAAALERRVARLQPLLTPHNYDGLVSLVLADIAKRAP